MLHVQQQHTSLRITTKMNLLCSMPPFGIALKRSTTQVRDNFTAVQVLPDTPTNHLQKQEVNLEVQFIRKPTK
jgi:hypothetical protein